MSNYDELTDQRLRILLSEWPTLERAHGCMDCKVIIANLTEQRTCTRCGSASTFDVARLLRGELDGHVIGRVRAMVRALEQALEGENSSD